MIQLPVSEQILSEVEEVVEAVSAGEFWLKGQRWLMEAGLRRLKRWAGIQDQDAESFRL